MASSNQRKFRVPRQRRGIVLLIIISLLVLFMLILVTFVVVAGHYRQAAQSFATRNYYTTDPRDDADNVLQQILVGPSQPYSSLFGHSLLGDLYGNDGAIGVVSANGTFSQIENPSDHTIIPNKNGAFVQFTFNSPMSEVGVHEVNPQLNINKVSSMPGYYAGCVLTMLDGDLKGLSTRITHYDPSSNLLRVEAFTLENSTATSLPQAGNRFVINGKPFNGTGYGKPLTIVTPAQPPTYPYDYIKQEHVKTIYANDDSFTRDIGFGPMGPLETFSTAFLPHLALYGNATNSADVLRGGEDEPWDTFDYQNPFLAMVPYFPPILSAPNEPLIGNDTWRILPSFHRPELKAYWFNRARPIMAENIPSVQTGTTVLAEQAAIFENPFGPDKLPNTPDEGNTPYSSVSLNNRKLIAELRRGSEFRPLPFDHPDFTGSSKFPGTDADNDGLADLDSNSDNKVQLTELQNANQYDVDNDGDGITDSIWIDPGLQVVTAPNGRKYKRLVALMIRDLDGRINVNANGTTEYIYQEMNGSSPHQPGTALNSGGNEPLAGNPAINAAYGARGFGFGPAEINFTNLFSNNPAGSYRELLQGTATDPGRYGMDNSGNKPNDRRPGVAGPKNSVAVTNDPLSAIKTQGIPWQYTNSATNQVGIYATPPDVWGRSSVALDLAGFPYPFHAGENTVWDLSSSPNDDTLEWVDNPYEINLVDASSPGDTPYSLAELERVLREFDFDVQGLPDRLLRRLGNSSDTTGRNRNGNVRKSVVTTLSSHIPAPPGGQPRSTRLSPTPIVGGGYTPLQSTKDYSQRYPLNGTTPGVTTKIALLPDNQSILDYAANRIRFENVGAPLTDAQVNDILQAIMPFEFFRGEKFNVNRPFGNGIDDNGNGVVDEPSEQIADGIDNDNDSEIDEADEIGTATAWTQGSFYTDVTQQTPVYGLGVDNINNYPSGPQKQKDARQLYARHLYCLLRLLCDPVYEGTTTEGGADKKKLYAQRLAQYAINVVDFRDPDAIMTPFEYDTNPFNGWITDGDLSTDESNLSTAPTNPNGTSANTQMTERAIVWGMEAPELLINESLAFHNRRVNDTAHDETGKKRFESMKFVDDDVDQYGIPEGSLFVELKSTRAPSNNNPRLPYELYNGTALDIGRLAPSRKFGATDVAHPVWRAVVTKNPDNNAQGLLAKAKQFPDTANLSIPFTVANNPPDPTVQPEKIIWFAPQAPNGHPEADLVYYNRSTLSTMQPGEYLVVGPRASTSVGALKGGSDGNVNTPQQSPRSFVINSANNRFSTTGGTVDDNGYRPYPQTALNGLVNTPVAGIVCAANTPTSPAWANNTRPAGIGINISEPLPSSGKYYLEPRFTDAGGVRNYYCDLDDVHDPAASPPNECYDKPFDQDNNLYKGPLTENPSNVETKTMPSFRALFLQRLANPLIAWNPDPKDPQFGPNHDANLPINPYITIDWSELDLTVFSGDFSNKQETDMNGVSEWLDTADEEPFATTNPLKRERFGSRQRGDINQIVSPTSSYDSFLWPGRSKQAEFSTDIAPDDNNADHYFNHKPTHSLGFLNSTMGVPASSTVSGYTGTPDPNQGKAHPWLAWHSRPFANPVEMLLVPTCSPSRLGWEYQSYDPSSQKFDDSNSTVNSYDVSNSKNQKGYFPFLPNLFLSTKFDGLNELALACEPSDPDHGADWYKIFDFIETPSPYVGTERWYNPASTSGRDTTQRWGQGYRPPFNRLSRFRDPGRININTILEQEVWDAIASGMPNPFGASSNFWNRVVDSRRGFSATSGNMFPGNSSFPTMFANPFRPADAFDLMPNLHGSRSGLLSTQLKLRRPVDASYFRSDSPAISSLGSKPLFDVSFTDAYRDTERNPFFKYQGMTRFSNLITTNSNCYAVWMTIGYFEVEPNPNGIDAGHPDGYRLGQELGIDDGSLKRHRAFYILDRSIPVAYEPGRMHNADRCVLLRRYIE